MESQGEVGGGYPVPKAAPFCQLTPTFPAPRGQAEVNDEGVTSDRALPGQGGAAGESVACGLKAHACDLRGVPRSQLWAVVTAVGPWPGPLWPCPAVMWVIFAGLGTHEGQEEHTHTGQEPPARGGKGRWALRLRLSASVGGRGC